jgi:hypothetical protein
MYFVHEVIIAFSADAIHVWTWLGIDLQLPEIDFCSAPESGRN